MTLACPLVHLERTKLVLTAQRQSICLVLPYYMYHTR